MDRDIRHTGLDAVHMQVLLQIRRIDSGCRLAGQIFGQLPDAVDHDRDIPLAAFVFVFVLSDPAI
ncbi:MAG: hypothetical protein ACLU3I_17740 [Acutalibacteraceae bacterium]